MRYCERQGRGQDLNNVKASAHRFRAHTCLRVQATGPKEILAKYDVDQNGLLDKSEVTSILKELALREAEIQDSIEKVQAVAPPGKVDARKSRGARQAAALAGAAKAGVQGLGHPGEDASADAQLRAIGSLEQRLERVEGQVRRNEASGTLTWHRGARERGWKPSAFNLPSPLHAHLLSMSKQI